MTVAAAEASPGLNRDERREAGRARREQIPRGSHGDWEPAPDRPNPVAILEAEGATRLPDLLPIRYGRMLTSPFAFLRGAAAVMAIDLASTPVTGLQVQACGDAHVANFGEFATPERNVVFDLNDFDQTLPGPWEWDIKRLAASLAVVCRQRGFAAAKGDAVVTGTVRSYRDRVMEYAELRVLELWYAQIGLDAVMAHFPPEDRPLVQHDVDRARRRTHLRAVAKLTVDVDGRRQFADDPPLVVRLDGAGHDMDEVTGLIEGYCASLSDERRTLFDRFRLVDVARHVVGVGSVGTRCWVGLFEGPDHPEGDPLVLQVKEAQGSVLQPYVTTPSPEHNGRRIVTGQRMIQAGSDVFLGWSTGPKTGRQYYGRQLWDIKGQGDPLTMSPSNLARYSELCAWALARAHARTGDPVAIGGYLGTSDRFDQAITEFASRYAEQTERDHAALNQAATSGRIPVQPDDRQ